MNSQEYFVLLFLIGLAFVVGYFMGKFSNDKRKPKE